MVIQHEFYATARTRVVAPLFSPSKHRTVARLTTEIEVAGRLLVLAVDQLAAVDVNMLGPEIAFVPVPDQLTRSIDLLFTGH